MVAYLEKVKELMGTFSTAFIEVILRSKNAKAEAMAKLASRRDAKLLDSVSVEFLVEPNIRQ